MISKILLSILIFCCTASAFADGLKVGVSADYPPMVYQQEGQIVGVEADNAKAVGGIIGQELTLVNMPFEKLIPALQAGEIDVIMSGMTITPQRSELVLFTTPYVEIGQMAITTIDKAGRYAQPWSLRRDGVRVGVEPGTTGAQFVENELKNAQVKFFDNAAAAFAGLRNNDIDVYIHDAPTSWQLATSAENSDLISLYHPLTKEQLAWAVRKDDERLAAMLNDALQTMKGNGTMRYILNRWIPVTIEVQ
ncbi:MAG: transporter substrate-binding domain-containing protein [Halioglobus sp.]